MSLPSVRLSLGYSDRVTSRLSNDARCVFGVSPVNGEHGAGGLMSSHFPCQAVFLSCVGSDGDDRGGLETAGKQKERLRRKAGQREGAGGMCLLGLRGAGSRYILVLAEAAGCLLGKNLSDS